MPDRVTPVYVVGDLHRIVDPGVNQLPGENVPPKLQVSRFVYDQPSFDRVYEHTKLGPPSTPWQSLKKFATRSFQRRKTMPRITPRGALRLAARYAPILEWLPRYDWKNFLIPDLVTGLTMGFLNTPQAVAYALLASCPPVTGLYVSFFPLLVYIVMSSSRHCAMGTDAVTSILVGNLVKAHTADLQKSGNATDVLVNGTQFNQLEWAQINVGAIIALLTGLWQLIFGMLGAGGLVVYFSDQLVQGFTCGCGVHVFTSQLKYFFGIYEMKDYQGSLKTIKIWISFFANIHHTNPATFITAALSMAFLLLCKFYINVNKRILSIIRIPVPAELFVVIVGTLVSYLADLHEHYHVSIVNKIPLGMPPAGAPDFTFFNGSMIGESFALAVVTLSISITLGLLFANKYGYQIDPNQEFRAQGSSKIFGAFFQCFPSSISVAKTAVQGDVGGKTQVVSMVNCFIIFIVIMALGKYLEPLPKACLGAIVMASVIKLMLQFVELFKLWKLSLVDWSIFLAVFLGVVILDVDIGLAIGVGWAICTVMLRLQKPKVGTVGRLPGTDIYKRTDLYRKALEVPGIKIVRVDSPIYFANASYIRSRLYTHAEISEMVNRWKKVQEELNKGQEVADKDFAFAGNLALDNEPIDPDEEVEVKSVSKHSLKTEMNGGTNIEFRRISRAPQNFHRTVRLSVADRNGIVNEAFNEEDEEDEPTTHLIIDCSEICFVDVTGVGFLKKTQTECAAIDVEVLLACTNKEVRNMLELCGASEQFKPYQLFVTVHDAVLYALNKRQGMSA